MSLYPNYRPRGIHRDWDHCGMDVVSTGKALRVRGVPDYYGDPVDAVAWFDRNDHLRVIVADFAIGKRVTFRQRKHDRVITYSPISTTGGE